MFLGLYHVKALSETRFCRVSIVAPSNVGGFGLEKKTFGFPFYSYHTHIYFRS